MNRTILKFFLLFCFALSGYAADKVDEMLEAYGNLNYSKATRLAETMPENPKAKLVLALCSLFSPISQDIQGGLEKLSDLYKNENIPIEVWCEAALTYGRVAQLVQERSEIYGGIAENINPPSVFHRIIERAPESNAACTALLFELLADFDSSDTQKVESAFQRLENFCREFKGKKKYLVPLYLLADQKYIFMKKDFSTAVENLRKAYEIGIANPKDAEVVLYRIGRIYDLKLKKNTQAAKYYRVFLEKYPESGYAPAVERFLQELNIRTGKETNGIN